jgi:hypothetical protein
MSAVNISKVTEKQTIAVEFYIRQVHFLFDNNQSIDVIVSHTMR